MMDVLLAKGVIESHVENGKAAVGLSDSGAHDNGSRVTCASAQLPRTAEPKAQKPGSAVESTV